jgi:hypothetical protein
MYYSVKLGICAVFANRRVDLADRCVGQNRKGSVSIKK